MPPANEKQRQELHHFESFRRATGLLADYEPHCGDRPDIRATRGDETIGIEVTRLHAPDGTHGSRDYEQVGLQERLIQFAQSLHRQRVDEPWEVHVHPNRSRRLRKATYRRVARLLVDFVVSSRLGEQTYLSLSCDELWEQGFPEEIAHVNAIRLPGFGSPIWTLSGFGWVGATNRNQIQKTLDLKERTIHGFDPSIELRWIVLVCDGTVQSSMLEPHEGVSDEEYRSSFDRVFLLDHLDRCQELLLRSRRNQLG